MEWGVLQLRQKPTQSQQGTSRRLTRSLALVKPPAEVPGNVPPLKKHPPKAPTIWSTSKEAEKRSSKSSATLWCAGMSSSQKGRMALSTSWDSTQGRGMTIGGSSTGAGAGAGIKAAGVTSGTGGASMSAQ